MSRRFIVALVVSAAALPLAAQDDACSGGAPPHRSAAMNALLAPPSAPVIEAQATNISELAGVETLVARRNADGKIVFACVDSPAAAKRFVANADGQIATAAATSK